MPPKPLKLVVFGATGLVGRTMLEVLRERRLSIAELIPIASERSRGQNITFDGRIWTVSTPEERRWEGADAALLSPGAKVSARWVPDMAAAGVVCIDNTSAFREDPAVPLVVPEVNPDVIRPTDRIIANPNCSTIQMVVALQPLHQAFGLEEVIVATYQSASGAGQKGAAQLISEIEGEVPETSPFPHPLFNNVVPSIGRFRDGYCLEEWKMVNETRKIMSLPSLPVYPTTVRVPVLYSHSEALHLRFRNSVSLDRARKVLSAAPGLLVQDDPDSFHYPQPMKAAGKDEVFVGRLRQMPGAEYTLDLWVVADNLRKGAATNAVQILELMLSRGLLG